MADNGTTVNELHQNRGSQIELRNTASLKEDVIAPIGTNESTKIDNNTNINQLPISEKQIMILKEDPPTNCFFSIFPFLSPEWSGWNYSQQNMIRSFTVIRVLYIFFLVPYHATNAAKPHIIQHHQAYPSDLLPYPTTTHGFEYMMGLLVLSGWLGHATTKPGTTLMDIFKKKLLRMWPAYYFAAMPLTLFTIIYEASTKGLTSPGGGTGVVIQFVLELFTLGYTNPAMLFWTRNRPLWIGSVLLVYNYVSPWYSPWLRSFQAKEHLLLWLFFLVAFRITIACLYLYVITVCFPTRYNTGYTGELQLWMGTQCWLPFMGATLAEITVRYGKLTQYLSKNTIWRLTDLVTLATFAMAFFVLAPPAWGHSERSTLTGYYVNALCAYTDLLVWPFILFGLYLHGHDLSTITWLYSRWPRIWEDGADMAFSVILMHWPLLLLLQQSQAFVPDNPVALLMILGTVYWTVLFTVRNWIQPWEEICIAYFDPTAAATATAAATTVAMVKPLLLAAAVTNNNNTAAASASSTAAATSRYSEAIVRKSEYVRTTSKVQSLAGEVEKKNAIIHLLDEEIDRLQREVERMKQQQAQQPMMMMTDEQLAAAATAIATTVAAAATGGAGQDWEEDLAIEDILVRGTAGGGVGGDIERGTVGGLSERRSTAISQKGTGERPTYYKFRRTDF